MRALCPGELLYSLCIPVERKELRKKYMHKISGDRGGKIFFLCYEISVLEWMSLVFDQCQYSSEEGNLGADTRLALFQVSDTVFAATSAAVESTWRRFSVKTKKFANRRGQVLPLQRDWQKEKSSVQQTSCLTITSPRLRYYLRTRFACGVTASPKCITWLCSPPVWYCIHCWREVK